MNLNQYIQGSTLKGMTPATNALPVIRRMVPKFVKLIGRSCLTGDACTVTSPPPRGKYPLIIQKRCEICSYSPVFQINTLLRFDNPSLHQKAPRQVWELGSCNQFAGPFQRWYLHVGWCEKPREWTWDMEGQLAAEDSQHYKMY